ncbi:uncharacterized protein LOC110975730 [Acanthaster planci]|uniref:Uncharacterized protein LOC110975730 n=1 Tax=Acanthaster planci TaxID=133434 RepID=A0A8B7XVU0_ACAPL|nr:uncharacterized protein LOC110975730 [Acanthaster planci]
MAMRKPTEFEDSLSSLRTSEGWGFDEQPHSVHSRGIHKTGSVSFQNALLDLKKDQELIEVDEEDSDAAEEPPPDKYQPQGRSEDLSDQAAEIGNEEAGSSRTRTVSINRGRKKDLKQTQSSSKVEEGPDVSSHSDGRPQGAVNSRSTDLETGESANGDHSTSPQEVKNDSGNRLGGVATRGPNSDTIGSPRTAGLVPHPPTAPSPRPTRRHSKTRRSDSSNAPKKAPQGAATHLKPKLDLSFRETVTVSDEGSDKSPLPELRESRRPFSHDNFLSKPTEKVFLSRAHSPVLRRKKSSGVLSPVPARRRSEYDQPMRFLSDNYQSTQTQPLHQASPATHAFVPSLDSASSSRPDGADMQHFSSVNLPPISSPTRHRRYSSVVPPALASPTDPSKHVSSSILAQTFGGKGGGGVGIAKQRRVSQAVNELLHIEEIRRASEMRNIVSSGQPGLVARDIRSQNLGDMMHRLKDCRYLRASTNEEELV